MATTKSGAPDSEDLHAQIAILRKDISAITDTLGAMAKAQKDGMTEAAAKRYDEAMTHAQARATALNAQAQEFVHEKPALSLGMAAALGFVVGIMSTSRR